MRDIIKNIYNKINIQEDIEIINKILAQVYLCEGISTKSLALKNGMPIPIITVIKKELIKAGLLKQDAGIRLTNIGIGYVEDELGYKNLNREVYNEIINNPEQFVINCSLELQSIYDNRPQVDVTLDQAKATIQTSFERAVLCLMENDLINKKIICLGDDDLTSLALAYLVKKLNIMSTEIIVLELDKRISNYINSISKTNNFDIMCYDTDLRKVVLPEFINYFDVVFVDPPYSINGLELFVSRALSVLKKEDEKTIYLSFANKSNKIKFEIQEVLNRMGIVISEVIRDFNEYEGATKIANSAQLYILKTFQKSMPIISEDSQYTKKLYTNDFKNSKRKYQCKKCNLITVVGNNEKIRTIEKLKEQGCTCGNNRFELLESKNESIDKDDSSEAYHLVLDLYECNNSLLNDLDFISKLMNDTAVIAKAEVVTSNFHQFNPYGISGVVIIKESHLTIHTWPEYNYAAIDIFSCSDCLAVQNACDYLVSLLECESVKQHRIQRKLKDSY